MFRSAILTSVASFLVLGGGGQDPQMYRQKKVTYMRERAKRASASETYIFRSPNTSAHTINAVPLYYFGMTLYRQYNDKILTLRESMSMRASVASELRKCLYFRILKLLFPLIFCWYFRYFVSETHSFNVQTTNICIYIARGSEASERLRNIYFQDSNISAYINNQCSSFNYLWYGTINYSIPTKH